MAKSKKLSAADKVVVFIHNLVREKGLEPGDALPTEREIAQALGMSRATVREGMGRLRALGFLEAKTKSGARLSRTDPHILFSEVIPTLAQTGAQVRDLAEFRIILESGAAALAAKRRSAANLRALEKIIVREKAALRDGLDAYNMLDKAFHFEVLKSAHNYLVLAATDVSRSHIDNPRGKRMMMIEKQWDAIMTRSHLEHVMILNAIRKRDTSEARTIMQIHIESTLEPLEQAL